MGQSFSAFFPTAPLVIAVLDVTGYEK